MRTLKNNIKEAYNLDNSVHSRELMDILNNKSEMSNNILDEYLSYLVIGLSNLIDLFEPEAICFGGSFAYYENIFMDKLKNRLFETNTTFNGRKDIDLVLASMKNDAGILGAII